MSAIPKGFFGIGVWHPKHACNVGTLFRSAVNFGASFVFTVGPRYERQSSDTTNTCGEIPLYHYSTLEDLRDHLPYGTPIVGIELAPEAELLSQYAHPLQACYLLGAEDHGLSPKVLEKCHKTIAIGGTQGCLNVSVAGSLIMYDRWCKLWPQRVLERAFS